MNKEFDCVEMKRDGAAELQKKLKGMSLDEELNFWNERTQMLKNAQERLIKNAREHRNKKRQAKKQFD